MAPKPTRHPLLESDGADSETRRVCNSTTTPLIACFVVLPLIVALAYIIPGFALVGNLNGFSDKLSSSYPGVVQSPQAVVTSDDGRCSEIGVSMLQKGGQAVDAAVATALCLGIVCPMSSGIGGGGFMVVRSPSAPGALAIDFRETAPAAASENMYENNPTSKYKGPLSMGVPGEIAGLHVAWLRYGRLPWRTLFEPSIKLAKDGFEVSPYAGKSIASCAATIMGDPGLRHVFAPNGTLLKSGETCYNVELGNTLEEIAEHGPEAFYSGAVGRKLVEDLTKEGGILTLDDLRNYKVRVTDAMTVNSMGYTIYGMPPPSSGTVGLALILNILESYRTRNAAEGPLGLHRLIEAIKHMFAIRMGIGDPAFVDIEQTVSKMLSPSFAKKIQKLILDNTTFPSEYYEPRWSQPREHGTNHFSVVDMERNAVSITATVNFGFGGGVLSPSTGILLNNEMDDFSIPTDVSPEKLPPAPANFIMPNKRPLSSMAPLIVLKDNQLVGVIGGSGGRDIISAVAQVFVDHFILGMEPSAAVMNARIYHRLIPNVVLYENWTVVDGEHIELSKERREFLRGRGHDLKGRAGGAVCHLVVQQPPVVQNLINFGRKGSTVHGVLIAVSDPRKGGRPAAIFDAFP